MTLRNGILLRAGWGFSHLWSLQDWSGVSEVLGVCVCGGLSGTFPWGRLKWDRVSKVLGLLRSKGVPPETWGGDSGVG